MSIKILIIDDDPDDQELFIEAAKEVNFTIECISVYNGEEALNFLKNDMAPLPDYIFLDLNMPVLNGIQCLTEIKKIVYLVHIPVIICTTANRLQNEDEIRKLGAQHFFTKPVAFGDICRSIATVLDKFPVSK